MFKRCGGHAFAEKVRAYFGVKIAMYFAYLGHYTAALLWPAFLGTMFWLLSGTHQVNSCFCLQVCSHTDQGDDISVYICFQCFDAVVWVAGRTSSL